MHIQFVLSICRLASKLDLLVWQIVSMALSALDRHLLCTVQKHVMTSSRVDIQIFEIYVLLVLFPVIKRLRDRRSRFAIKHPNFSSRYLKISPDLSRSLQISSGMLARSQISCYFSKGNIEICLSP